MAIQLPDHDHVHCEECVNERMSSLMTLSRVQTRLEEANRIVLLLAEALRKYGDHSITCSKIRHLRLDPSTAAQILPCTCGFQEALDTPLSPKP